MKKEKKKQNPTFQVFDASCTLIRGTGYVENDYDKVLIGKRGIANDMIRPPAFSHAFCCQNMTQFGAKSEIPPDNDHSDHSDEISEAMKDIVFAQSNRYDELRNKCFISF